MGDYNHGWTTVGSRNHGQLQSGRGPEVEAQLEMQDCATIATWDRDAHWPGIDNPCFDGPQAKKFDDKLIRLHDLDQGAFGKVDKVVHDSVCLARKRIPRRRGFSIEDLRQEGLTMRKLLLDDLECLRTNDGDRDDIIERLTALDLTDLTVIDDTTVIVGDRYMGAIIEKCPLDYLQTIVGCVARAMAHCHANDVRHLDIKPSNILLRPDRVYLADFGISRDVSGQEQTTTDGVPGTERWRAPELYGDHGSSMQLSDMYSLGLVYLNIATVLYDARLVEFDETLSYSPRVPRQEQLVLRERKLKAHLDRLTSQASRRPPFMFTQEGRETVRPRPLTQLISRMVATNPRQRFSAAKTDEKLSMLGGINQIYHGHCCKRPMSWIENKWDQKFANLIALQRENDVQRKRITELEGMDKTYEARLENQRQKHEQDIARLQNLLKNAEEKCQRLDLEILDRRRSSYSSRCSHGPEFSRSALAGGRRNTPGPHQPLIPPGVVGLGMTINTTKSTPPRDLEGFKTKANTTVVVTSRRQQKQQFQSNFASTPGRSADKLRMHQSNPAATQSPSAARHSAGKRSPSISGNLPGYALQSRGSGSKLPLPVTPSRSNTPKLNRDQSMSDSSMSSSVFSRQSLETVPTPPTHDSSVVTQRAAKAGACSEDDSNPFWGQLNREKQSPTERSRCAEEDEESGYGLGSCTLSNTVPSMATFTLSCPRTRRSGCPTHETGAGADADPDPDATSRPRPTPPSLQPMKSWAEVAKLDHKRQVARESSR
ncbi:hypothetical protein E4U21_001014 [Claviceps maximensis]|nr:hypothetical protein E4U21_001014 [Claviceps maximensis]